MFKIKYEFAYLGMERSKVQYQPYNTIFPFGNKQLIFDLQQYERIYKGNISKLLKTANFYRRLKEMKADIIYSKNFDKEYQVIYRFKLHDIDT